MISEEVQFDQIPYLLYLLGQTGLSKHCRLISDDADFFSLVQV